MGGHGGLNILPQKRWNVYNYENREKVRLDEEAAAKEEQLKREQARKRDAEFRLEQLRAARGLVPLAQPQPEGPLETDKKPGHINLFEGIRIFDPVKGSDHESGEGRDGPKRKKMKKEEAPRAVSAEDEKYRLGYGVAGKGVKLPWYLEKRRDDDEYVERVEDDGSSRGSKEESGKKSGKKTLEELREERLKREKKEKQRVQELVLGKVERDGNRRNALDGRGFSRR